LTEIGLSTPASHYNRLKLRFWSCSIYKRQGTAEKR